MITLIVRIHLVNTKLCIKLETIMNNKTRNKIKLDNKVIEKIKIEDLDFSYINKSGETKFKRMLMLPFDAPKRSLYKALVLSVQKDTEYKHFWLRFWFNSKSDYYTI